MSHIFDFDQTRENLVIQRILTGVGPPMTPRWLEHLGWNPHNCWFALNIPTDRVLSAPPVSAPGDLDVIGGPLEASSDEVWAQAMAYAEDELGRQGMPVGNIRSLAWSQCIESRELKWPPDMAHAAAAEFKAGRFQLDGRVVTRTHRLKYQTRAREQANGLCALGFRRVALVHVLGGQRALDLGQPGVPWLNAGISAQAAIDSFGRHLLVDQEDDFATIAVSVSAVTDADETFDGASGPALIVNQGTDNAGVDATVKARYRQAIVDRLAAVFEDAAFDGRLPVLLLACVSARCGHLYMAGDARAETRCPKCGRLPTISAR